MRNAIFIVTREASASIHDEGIVILNLGNGRMYMSNGIGARIWRGVERRLSLRAITTEISDQYEIAYSTAREHIVRFLTELQRHALIQREVES